MAGVKTHHKTKRQKIQNLQKSVENLLDVLNMSAIIDGKDTYVLGFKAKYVRSYAEQHDMQAADIYESATSLYRNFSKSLKSSKIILNKAKSKELKFSNKDIQAIANTVSTFAKGVSNIYQTGKKVKDFADFISEFNEASKGAELNVLKQSYANHPEASKFIDLTVRAFNGDFDKSLDFLENHGISIKETFRDSTEAAKREKNEYEKQKAMYGKDYESLFGKRIPNSMDVEGAFAKVVKDIGAFTKTYDTVSDILDTVDIVSDVVDKSIRFVKFIEGIEAKKEQKGKKFSADGKVVEQGQIGQKEQLQIGQKEERFEDIEKDADNAQKYVLIKKYSDLIEKGLIKPQGFMSHYEEAEYIQDIMTNDEWSDLMEEAVQKGEELREKSRQEQEEVLKNNPWISF